MVPESQSAPQPEEPPATGEAASSPAPNRKPRQVTTLSQELADFLIAFSIVLHKRSMYPAGHPHLQDSADRFMRRMQALLKERETVTPGVARHRLVIDAAST